MVSLHYPSFHPKISTREPNNAHIVVEPVWVPIPFFALFSKILVINAGDIAKCPTNSPVLEQYSRNTGDTHAGTHEGAQPVLCEGVRDGCLYKTEYQVRLAQGEANTRERSARRRPPYFVKLGAGFNRQRGLTTAVLPLLLSSF